MTDWTGSDEDFLEQFEEYGRTSIENTVYDMMAEFCEYNDISTEEYSREDLEEFAEAFVERGFTVDS